MKVLVSRPRAHVVGVMFVGICEYECLGDLWVCNVWRVSMHMII